MGWDGWYQPNAPALPRLWTGSNPGRGTGIEANQEEEMWFCWRLCGPGEEALNGAARRKRITSSMVFWKGGLAAVVEVSGEKQWNAWLLWGHRMLMARLVHIATDVSTWVSQAFWRGAWYRLQQRKWHGAQNNCHLCRQTLVLCDTSQKWYVWQQKVVKIKSKRTGGESTRVIDAGTITFETIIGGFANEVFSIWFAHFTKELRNFGCPHLSVHSLHLFFRKHKLQRVDLSSHWKSWISV